MSHIDVQPDEVVLVPVELRTGEAHYFPGATELVDHLKKRGIKARKSHPEGDESVAHLAIYEDLPAIIILWEYLGSPLYRTFLNVLKEYVVLRIKGAMSVIKPNRSVVAQFHFFVRKPDGSEVHVRYAGEDAEDFERFAEVADEYFFRVLDERQSSRATPDSEATQHQPASESDYVSHPNRDVYHRSKCGYILQGIEPVLRNRQLLLHADAISAVALGKRPCKMCKPPWIIGPHN